MKGAGLDLEKMLVLVLRSLGLGLENKVLFTSLFISNINI